MGSKMASAVFISIPIEKQNEVFHLRNSKSKWRALAMLFLKSLNNKLSFSPWALV
jgi:hypothetical protein